MQNLKDKEKSDIYLKQKGIKEFRCIISTIFIYNLVSTKQEKNTTQKTSNTKTKRKDKRLPSYIMRLQTDYYI